MVMTYDQGLLRQPDPAADAGRLMTGPLHRMAQSIANLKIAVEDETKILQSGNTADLADYNVRKSHGLVELTRAMRSLGDRPPSNDVVESLRELRQSLARNEGMLKLHMEAVREVAHVMTKAISDSESDGTYTASIQNVAKHYV